MNFHRCLSWLYLLFVLCFALYSASFTAHAASANTTPIEIEESTSAEVSSYSTEDVASTIDKIQYLVLARETSNTSSVAYLLDKTIQAGSWGIQNSIDIMPYRGLSYFICENFRYSKGTNNLIASKGSSVKFELSGIYNRVGCEYSSNYYESRLDSTNINEVLLNLFDKSGNVFYSSTLSNSSFYDISDGLTALNGLGFEIDNLSSDLYKIECEVRFHANEVFTDIPIAAWSNPTYYKLAFGLGDKTMLQVFVDDGSKGLLKGIKEIVSNIKDGISNLLTGIIELPSKLWNLIENGLKGLFVPSESEMTEIKGQWDTLLSDRFGGLYQTVQLIDDYAESFKDPNDKNTITLPELKLPFGQSEFVFGGQEVQIVPEKFSFLIDVLKTIISIIATCLFVNGLRNRFERLVGGQE